MSDSMGRGPGIERCDECLLYEDDYAAAEAHDAACGCGMKIAELAPLDDDDDEWPEASR